MMAFCFPFFIGPLASPSACHLVSFDYVGDQAWTNMCAWFSWDYNLKVLPWKSQAPGGRWVEMTLWINTLWSFSMRIEKERWAFNNVHRTRGRRSEPLSLGRCLFHSVLELFLEQFCSFLAVDSLISESGETEVGSRLVLKNRQGYLISYWGQRPREKLFLVIRTKEKCKVFL